WKQSNKRHLIILNYHRTVNGNLRSQMRYLRRHYRIMHLEDALEVLYASDQASKTRDRRIPLVLTFDDGYLDNYTYGWPLARRLRIPMTIFLIPGYTDSGKCFWWLAGEYLVSHTKIDNIIIGGRMYCLAEAEDRKALTEDINIYVRHATTVDAREAFLEEVQQKLGVSLPKRTGKDADDIALPMTWAEIDEMEQSGWVSFGAHTMHHPILAYVSDLAEVEHEVAECRSVLEQRLGHSIRTFAYPIGKLEHIESKGLHAVKKAGYPWALTTIEEANTPQTDPLLLRRQPGDITQHWLITASE